MSRKYEDEQAENREKFVTFQKEYIKTQRHSPRVLRNRQVIHADEEADAGNPTRVRG